MHLGKHHISPLLRQFTLWPPTLPIKPSGFASDSYYLTALCHLLVPLKLFEFSLLLPTMSRQLSFSAYFLSFSSLCHLPTFPPPATFLK